MNDINEPITTGPKVRKSNRISWMVLTARVISIIFSPFYLPVLAFVVLFMFSYLNMLPVLTKIILTLIVYFFTVLLPRLCIYLYCKLNGWSNHQLGKRERRYVPYTLSIISNSALLYLLMKLHMPRFTLGIIAGALIIQILCTIINSYMKISIHAAAAGGVIGAIVAFSMIFAFDPTGWLCLAVLLCGLICTAQLILRQHNYKEQAWGVAIGIVSGFISILFI